MKAIGQFFLKRQIYSICEISSCDDIAFAACFYAGRIGAIGEIGRTGQGVADLANIQIIGMCFVF